MKKQRILYVYRTKRKPIFEHWKKGKDSDSKLFGINHLRQMNYQVDFFDSAYSLFNPWHWLFYPMEHMIINQIGMGFKLDQAVTLLTKLKGYDVIVCTGDSSGLPFLFLKHLGIIKKPIIYMSAVLAGPLKDHYTSWVIPFYRKIFRVADVITCYAQVERNFLIRKINVSSRKIKYIPYGTDWWFWSKPSKKKRTIVAAAGIDSSRDYDTFFRAVKGLDIKVEIACHPDNIKGLDVPVNVKARFMISPLQVRSMFQRAKVLVVPLKEMNRSSGQMVILEAASAKTPLVVSKIQGVTGAFKFKDKSHLVYTPPGKPQIMRRKIMYLLARPKLASLLGKAASNYVYNHYTSRHLAQNVANLIDSL